MDQAPPSLDGVFADVDFSVRGIYENLIAAIRVFGPFAEQPVPTGVHLKHGEHVFAGAVPQKDKLVLAIRCAQAIASARMRKIEQVEGSHFQNELLLGSPNDVDEELIGWLRSAYDLRPSGS